MLLTYLVEIIYHAGDLNNHKTSKKQAFREKLPYKKLSNPGIAKIGLTPQFWHTGGFDDKKCVNSTCDN